MLSLLGYFVVSSGKQLLLQGQVGLLFLLLFFTLKLLAVMIDGQLLACQHTVNFQRLESSQNFIIYFFHHFNTMIKSKRNK